MGVSLGIRTPHLGIVVDLEILGCKSDWDGCCYSVQEGRGERDSWEGEMMWVYRFVVLVLVLVLEGESEGFGLDGWAEKDGERGSVRV